MRCCLSCDSSNEPNSVICRRLVDYERDATSSVCSTAHGQHWQAHIEIDRESAERNLLASLTVLVEVDVINSWFGTSL
eukprot:m.231848 g.231848  ORF g.231848 m.231848 type:complete len:78 (+) comp18878_c0_seq6:2138-2371(+)